MSDDLPKVIWTSPDGAVRAVFVGVFDHTRTPSPDIRIEVESLEKDAMGAPAWVDRNPEQWLAEIIADLSGVKWRETLGDG